MSWKTPPIPPLANELAPALQARIDNKTKPPRSLGRLEEIALRLGLMQATVQPKLVAPHVLVFAGDHGLAREGVSPFPPEVTPQMVLNFLAGGAGINVLARLSKLPIKVIDAGVAVELPDHPDLIKHKVRLGTRNATVMSDGGRIVPLDRQLHGIVVQGRGTLRRTCRLRKLAPKVLTGGQQFGTQLVHFAAQLIKLPLQGIDQRLTRNFRRRLVPCEFGFAGIDPCRRLHVGGARVASGRRRDRRGDRRRFLDGAVGRHRRLRRQRRHGGHAALQAPHSEKEDDDVHHQQGDDRHQSFAPSETAQ